jgi:hypothetical protein
MAARFWTAAQRLLSAPGQDGQIPTVINDPEENKLEWRRLTSALSSFILDSPAGFPFTTQ